jgi:two-component system, OmpR family, phosphate regulon sensor histidine kinase PhoR
MQKLPGLASRFFLTYLLVVAVTVTSLGWYGFHTLTHLVRERLFKDLQAQAMLVADLVGDRFSRENAAEVDAVLKQLGRRTSIRVTVGLPDAELLGDSLDDVAHIGHFAGRPEVKEAVAGRVGTSTRRSVALNIRTTSLAYPVKRDDQVIGIVRVSVPAVTPWDILKETYPELLAAVLVSLVAAWLLCKVVVHRITGHVLRLKKDADRFGEGDLTTLSDITASAEFGSLAESMNNMAASLHRHIESVTKQRNEIEAVLSAMVESVLLVDVNQRVLRVNQAAEGLFGITGERVRNRSIQECIRNTDLHRFVATTLAGEEPVEGDLVFIGDPDRFLQAHGVNLRDVDGKSGGALVVVNDVTRLKTLEIIRRDFVANVSHELKTPITSIKGFLETLREGAIHDPENAERFLGIIMRHTDRLSMIIEDLLSLSRIETDTQKGQIVLEEGPLEPVLEAVAKSCRKKAEAKDIHLDFATAAAISAHINPTLLEQALVNLVDNAIKYSEPARTVKVEARKGPDEITIQVRDQGYGISREHLARIFERFYRVDKARSRKVGGTGLGLAIVRHIVNAHGGKITVQSSPGQGSTFTVHLPVSTA